MEYVTQPNTLLPSEDFKNEDKNEPLYFEPSSITALRELRHRISRKKHGTKGEFQSPKTIAIATHHVI